MKTVFKYMSFLGMDYFDNPTARISLIEELNDPFECCLSDTIEHLINKFVEGVNSPRLKEIDIYDTGEITREEVSRFIFGAQKGIGVISFSETNRNLLMWAHYANNHRGICIELESDWSISKERLIDTQSNNLHCFRRVQYDTKRVDFSEHDFFKNSEPHNALSKLFVKQLTLKSDEWMYEKEHRYIMSFLEADYILKKPNSIIPKDIDIKLKKLATANDIVKEKNGYRTTHCQENEFFYEAFSSEAFMYLTKIPHEKIKSIYLGHRFKDTDAHELVNRVKFSEHPLHHVKIYKCTISYTRFELEIEKIY
ncbi:DUF2971 domain-containing protein [Aeromonas hydrophila]|uniref:DUF2971 domain-containing protein n=1 Tax=Aeromonas hydrophila TaxID=644 RepID=UPI003988EF7B